MRRLGALPKRYLGLAYLLVVAVVFVAWALHTGQVPSMIRQLGQLDGRWIALSAVFLAGYVLLRALTLHAYLVSEKCPVGFWKSLAVTGIGQFYSAITPSSSGGQPLEVFAMARWGVPGPVATAAVSVQFICFQVALIALGAALWLASRAQVAAQLGGVRWFAAFGFLLNALLPLMVFLLGANRRLTGALTRGALRLAARLKLIRRPEAAQHKLDRIVGEYQGSVTALFRKPRAALMLMLLSLAQIVLLMSIIVGVHRAFALPRASGLTLVTLQTLLYISASFMPLPGSSGAQEYGFTVFFRGIFPDSMMLSAIFCWRTFTFYILLLFGFLSVLAEGGMRFLEKGQKEEEKADGTP